MATKKPIIFAGSSSVDIDGLNFGVDSFGQLLDASTVIRSIKKGIAATRSKRKKSTWAGFTETELETLYRFADFFHDAEKQMASQGVVVPKILRSQPGVLINYEMGANTTKIVERTVLTKSPTE